jgi:UDP-glucose 4-epimerase
VGEHYCRVFSSLYGLETICLRYLNVYGPRQSPDSQYAAVIPRFIHSISNGKGPVVFGDGLQTRDFVFVKDAVQANILAMKSKVKQGIFNVGTGKPVNLLELVDRINRVAGRDLRPVFSDPSPGDIRHSVADIRRIREALGYRPSCTLEDGLKQTLDWFTSSRSPSSSSRPSA